MNILRAIYPPWPYICVYFRHAFSINVHTLIELTYYNGVTTSDANSNNQTISQSKNGTFMMLQSFLAVSDDVHFNNTMVEMHKMWPSMKNKHEK